MDWDDLRYVLAVSNAGSLAEAAKRLAVDKATVSRRVGALETTLDVRLFDRLPAGYRLTPHGERVVAAVADIDRVVASLEADLSEARGDSGGVVYVTVPQFFASQVLFGSLAAFRAAHPKIELVINASSSVLDIAHREAEVGLRNVRPDQRSVTVRRLGFLGSAMYASRAYLSAHGRPRTSQALALHELVGWDRAFTFVEHFAWVGETGAQIAVRVNDAAVLADAVAAGAGIGVLPCILGDERKGLVALSEFGRSRDAIHAVAPGELRRSARVRAVLDLLDQVWKKSAKRLEG